jgi:hypothetical protein
MSTVIDATIRMIVEGDHNRAYAALVDVLAQSPLTDEVSHSIVESFEHVNQEEADRWLEEQEKKYTRWLSLWLNP